MAASSLSHSRHDDYLGMQKYFEFSAKLGKATFNTGQKHVELE